MGIRSRIADAVSNWFNGTYVPPPNSGVFIVGGYYERHWTARSVGALGSFIAAEWKWILGFIAAVCGVAVAAAKPFF